MSDPGERRNHPRYELFAQIQLSQDAEIYVMSTENISEGGVFVQGDPEDFPSLDVGSEVELLLFPAENLMLELSCRAHVVRVQEASEAAPPGYGLMFDDVDEGSRERLAQLLAPREAPPPPTPAAGDVKKSSD